MFFHQETDVITRSAPRCGPIRRYGKHCYDTCVGTVKVNCSVQLAPVKMPKQTLLLDCEYLKYWTTFVKFAVIRSFTVTFTDNGTVTVYT